MKKQRTCLLLALAFAPLALPAQAAGICNAFDPNSEVVAQVPGPMGVPIPICTQRRGAVQGEASRMPERDPRADAVASATDYGRALSRVIGATAENARVLAANPVYARLSKGEWQYFDDPATGSTGAGCTAIFANLEGMLTVTSRGGADQPVMMRFVGREVPAPAKMARVTIELSDTGKPPQPMPAYNLVDPLSGMGSFGIALANLAGTLAVFQDSGQIAIDLNGKRLFDIKYHDGAQMKQRFKRCALAGQ